MNDNYSIVDVANKIKTHLDKEKRYVFTEAELKEHNKEILDDLYQYLFDKLYKEEIEVDQIMYKIKEYIDISVC